jgi:DNA-binding SARP family transcriptional activator
VTTSDEFCEPAHSVEVRLLGWVGLAAAGTDEEWCDVQAKTVELIAWLVTHPGPQTAERIRDDLWRDRTSSAKTLNNHASSARKRLGLGLDGALLFPSANDDRYRLSPLVVTDVDRLQRRLRWARDAPPARALSVLRDALALVRGRPFATRAGYEWAYVDQLVFHAEQLVVDVANRLGELCLGVGDSVGALWATAGGLRGRPGDETLYQLRMRAFAAQGNRTSVHRSLDELRTFLDGAEPSATTREIYDELMGQRRLSRPT